MSDKPRRCDNCLHFTEVWNRTSDGSDFCQYTCGLHSVAGGWARMPTQPESRCVDHEFYDERAAIEAAQEPKYPTSDWPRFLSILAT